MKDGLLLTTDGSNGYTLTQTVTDRSSSTYSNVLTLSATSGVTGTYTCTVTNDLGSATNHTEVVGKCAVCYKECPLSTIFMLPGITISGLEGPLTVGQSATITCDTDTTVSSIEWRDNSSNVVASAMNRAALDYHIPVVTDDLHGQQYTCEAVATSDDGTNTTYTEMVEIQVVGRY